MRILMTMFGWADSGGGTIFPRQLALELRRRGHDVLVIYAAVPPMPDAPAYAVSELEEAGVRLIGIHNRPAAFLDDRAPQREIADLEIVRIVQRYFVAFQPDLVHYHNFLGLSLGISAIAHAAQVPSLYTPYNFWLLCPTLYLTLPDLASCHGPDASGCNCLACTRAPLGGAAYVTRRDRLQADYSRQVGPCLATSDCVRDLLLENGYPAGKIDVLHLGNERADRLWVEVGMRRKPGVSAKLRIGFVGSLLPIKGVHLLVAAAQQLDGAFEVVLHGEGPPAYLRQLKALDGKGIVEFAGRFSDAEHGQLLARLDVGVVPSICVDHSPLVIGEFQAARVPVVGARIGGIPDYVQPGAGALFEAGNVAELAATLQSLIDDPSRLVGWQARLRAPLSFGAYVDALEARYAAATDAHAEERLTRRIERFVCERGRQTYYDARYLLPLDQAQPPYGVDLASGERPEQVGTETLEGASWVMVTDPAHLAAIERAPAIWLPPWRGPVAPAELDLPADRRWLVLLLLQADDEGWREPVSAWNLRLTAQDDVALVLLPWNSRPERCQGALLELLAGLAVDPAAAADMILLELDGGITDLAALVRRFALTVLTSALCEDPRCVWSALNCPALLQPRLGPQVPAGLARPAGALPVLAAWLEALPGWQLLAPDPQGLERQFSRQCEQMRDLLSLAGQT